MSTTPCNRELVYCHSCEEEWYRDQYGLQCPQCGSEAVEIIDPSNDVRSTSPPPLEAGTYPEPAPEDRLPHNPLHQELRDHRLWSAFPQEMADPEEGDIDHVEWRGPRGIHFSQTTYRSSSGTQSPNLAPNANIPPGLDAFPNMLASILRGTAPGQQNANPFGGSSRSPPINGPGRTPYGAVDGRSSRIRGGITITTRTGGGINTQHLPMDDLTGILTGFLRAFPGNPGGLGGPGARGDGIPRPGPNSGFADFLQALINPANARSGDAVFTQEAFDRVMSQLMEQHSGTAPGPASAAAIDALPQIQVSAEMQDEKGKAECSICMDEVQLGSEVTQLPCKHWFHAECVSAWLREHDTCPQCRRGIMPKEGDGTQPRSTGEAPRFWQMPGSFPSPLASPTSESPGGRDPPPSASRRSSRSTRDWAAPSPPISNAFDGERRYSRQAPPDMGNRSMSGDGSTRNPFYISSSPTSPVSERSYHSRRRSSQGQDQDQRREQQNSNGRSGITGWMGRRFGSGGGSSGASGGAGH